MPVSCLSCIICLVLFFFIDTASTEIYTLSLHDALPISLPTYQGKLSATISVLRHRRYSRLPWLRSEEHTSELQSPMYLVCRLLLEKKKTIQQQTATRPQLTTLTAIT